MFAQVKLTFLRRFPIKSASAAAQRKIADRVERIQAAKQRNGEADTNALEREIDQLVYALYDLTPEEIDLVESSAAK